MSPSELFLYYCPLATTLIWTLTRLVKREASGPSTTSSTTRNWRGLYSSRVAQSGQHSTSTFFPLLMSRILCLTIKNTTTLQLASFFFKWLKGLIQKKLCWCVIEDESLSLAVVWVVMAAVVWTTSWTWSWMMMRRSWMASLRTGIAPPPPVVLFIYTTTLLTVTHFNEIHENLHQYFLFLVAGSPELCACECPQRTHLGQSIYRPLLFFLPHVFFLVCDFAASSKAIFAHFFSVHVGSSLLCWQWIYTVRYWTFFFFLFFSFFYFFKDSVISSSSSINQYGLFDHKLSSPNKHTNTHMKTSPFMSYFQRRLPIDIWELRRSCHGWQELCASWLSFEWCPKKEVVRRTPAWTRTDRGLPYKDLSESRKLGPS